MNVVGNIVKRYLEKFINEYLQKDDRNLDIDISMGIIKLSRIKLKTAFINKTLTEVPVTIKDSFIDQITLTIPFSNIFREAVEARIKDLHIECVVKDADAENFDREYFLEVAKSKFREMVKNKVRPPQQTSKGFIQGMVQRIIDNLQIFVENVRIDVYSSKQNDEFNIMIKKFEFFTTDETFVNKIFFDRNTEQFKDMPICKKLILEGLNFRIGPPLPKRDTNEVLDNKNDKTALAAHKPKDIYGIFKFSFEVNVKIQTKAKESNEIAQNTIGISVNTFDINLKDDQVRSIIMLLSEISKFKEKLFEFKNFEMLKPVKRIITTDGQNPDRRQVYVYRWWLYAFVAVSYQLREAEKERILKYIPVSNLTNESHSMPIQIQNLFKESVQRHLTLFLRNNYDFQEMHNENEPIDAAMILSYFNEIQLNHMINVYCKDIIQKEKKRKQQISVFKKMLRMFGLTSFSSDDEQLLEAFEDQMTGEEENFNFIFQVDLKFNRIVLTFNNTSSAMFKMTLSDFNFNLKGYRSKLYLEMKIRDFMVNLISGNSTTEVINYRTQKDANFLIFKMKSRQNDRVVFTLIEASMESINLLIKPQLIDEVFVLMMLVQQISNDTIANFNAEASIRKDILNRFRSIHSDFCFLMKINPIILQVDLGPYSYFELSSGSISFNLNYLSSKDLLNEMMARVQNCTVRYKLHQKTFEICNISLFITANTKTVYSVGSSTEFGIVADRIAVNFYPDEIARMLQDILRLIKNGEEKTLLMPNRAVFEKVMKISSDKDLPTSLWKNCLITIFQDKSIAIISSEGRILSRKIIDTKPVYISRYPVYVVKFEKSSDEEIFVFVESLEEMRFFVDMLFAREPLLRKRTLESSKSQLKPTIVIETLIQRLEIKTFEENNSDAFSVSLHDFYFIFSSITSSIQIHAQHLLMEDLTLSNISKSKLVFHIGSMLPQDHLFYSNSKIDPQTSFSDQSISDLSKIMDFKKHVSIEKIEPSQYHESFFDVPQQLNERYLTDFFDKAFTIDGLTVVIDLKTPYNINIDLNTKKLLLFWNLKFLEYFKKYAIDNSERFLKILKKNQIIKSDSQQKSEDIEKKSNRSIRSGRELPLPTPDFTFLIKGSVEKLLLINFNQNAYQFEIVADDMKFNLASKDKNLQITIAISKLLLNDLTNYPFTLKFDDLRNTQSIRRSCIVSSNPTRMSQLASMVLKDDKKILEYLQNNTVVVDINLKDGSIVANQSFSGFAKVWVHALKVSYYHQVVMRVINFILATVLPFVLAPETFPDDLESLQKKLQTFTNFGYKIILLDTTAFLPANNFLKNTIRATVSKVVIHNEFLDANWGRDMVNADRTFHTERIFINIEHLKVYGFLKETEIITTNKMLIIINRMLFLETLCRIYGRDQMLEQTFFGMDISIRSSDIHIALSKNDFVLLMSFIFNNISYDDRRNKDLIYNYQENSKSDPMKVSVYFGSLFLEFRYDTNAQTRKIFGTFEIPKFLIDIDMRRNGEMFLTMESRKLIGYAVQVDPSFLSPKLKVIHFIKPIKDTSIPYIQEAMQPTIDLDKPLLEQPNIFTQLSHEADIDLPPPQLSGEVFDSSVRVFRTMSRPNMESGFYMDVLIKKGGDKSINMRLDNQHATIIPSFLMLLIELTKMTDEMNINNNILPVYNQRVADLVFNLTMNNILVQLPNDIEKYPMPLFLFVRKMNFTFSKLRIKPVEGQSLDQRQIIQRFHPFSNYTFPEISGGFGLKSKVISDGELESMQIEYLKEKFDIFDTVMRCGIEGVDIFLTDYMKLDLFQAGVASIGISHRSIIASEKNDSIRYIMRDLGLTYESSTLTNDAFKNLALGSTRMRLCNLEFHLSGYDMNYLMSFKSYVEQFQFDQIKFLDEANNELGSVARERRMGDLPSKATPSPRSLMEIEPINCKVLLLDDVFLTGIPLLRFEIASTKFVNYVTHMSSGILNLNLKLDSSYYNFRITKWEPVFENISVVFKSSSNPENTIGVTEIFADNQLMTIDISTEFLDLVLTYLENFNTMKETSPMDSFLFETDQVVRNCLSFDVRLKFVYRDGFERVLSIPSDKSERLFVHKSRRSRENVEIKYLDVESLVGQRHFKVARINKFENAIVKASKEPGKEPFSFILNCDKLSGQRHLTLYSNICIENKTSFEILVKLMYRGNFAICKIPSLTSKNVPPEFEDGGFAIKVSSQRVKGQPYSSAFFFKNAYNSIAIEDTLFFVVETKKEPRTQITIRPTVEVFNFLLHSFTLVFDNSIVAREHRIRETQESQFIYENMFESGTFRLILGALKSGDVQISIAKKEFEIQVEDPEMNRSMLISVRLIQDSNIKVIFYFKAILLNQLVGPFNFSQSIGPKELKASIIKPGQAGNSAVYFINPTEDIFVLDRTNSIRIRVGVNQGNSFYSFAKEGNVMDEISVSVKSETHRVGEHVKIKYTVVTVRPKYLFINKTKYTVLIEQLNRSKDLTSVGPNEKMKLQVRKMMKDPTQNFRIRHEASYWSEPIDFTNIGYFQFSIYKRESYGLDHFGIEINDMDSYFCLILHETEGFFHLENSLSNAKILVFQDYANIANFDYDLEVSPLTTAGYSWRFPMKQTNEIWFMFIDEKSREIINVNWQSKPSYLFELQRNSNKSGALDQYKQVYRLDMTKQLDKQEIMIDGKNTYMEVKVNRKQLIVAFIPIDASHASVAQVKDKKFILKVANLGLSVIYGKNRRRTELIYISFENYVLEIVDRSSLQEINIKLDSLQIDYNADPHPVFPVILCPYSEKAVGPVVEPFMHIKVWFSSLDTKGMIIYSLLEFNMKPISLKVEEDFVNHSLAMYDEISQNTEERTVFIVNRFNKRRQVERPKLIYEKNWKNEEFSIAKPTYIKNVNLSDLEVHVSYGKSALSQTKRGRDLFKPKDLAENYFSVVRILAKIDNLKIFLPMVKMKNENNTPRIILQKLFKNYRSRILLVLINLIGSADIIGNPLRLVEQVKTGVKDFIELPEAYGFIGFVEGTRSLVDHTVGGTFDTVNRITRTLGDGMSYLTSDHEYIALRNKMFATKQNKFFLGLARLGIGVYDGVTGTVIKPFKGLQKSKTEFFVGVYKGLSGLVLKPLAGTLDLASATSDGFKDIFSRVHRVEKRKRLPRAFYYEKSLLEDRAYYDRYNANDAATSNVIVSKEGIRMILVQEVNFGYEKIMVCFEGILIVDEKEIVWRKNIQNILGSIASENEVSIEFFDFDNNSALFKNKIVEVQNKQIGEKVVRAIMKAMSEFNRLLPDSLPEDLE